MIVDFNEINFNSDKLGGAAIASAARFERMHAIKR